MIFRRLSHEGEGVKGNTHTHTQFCNIDRAAISQIKLACSGGISEYKPEDHRDIQTWFQMLITAQMGNHYARTEETKVGLCYLNSPSNGLRNRLHYYLLFSHESVCLFRICVHCQSWVQKSSTVSTRFRMFRTAKHYTDVNCCCYWDLL